MLCRAGDTRLQGRRRRRAHLRPLAGWLASAAGPARRAPRAMQRLAMDLRVLSRELSLYLEHQVRVGFFGSGVGISLILGFSVAYACYYLSSIAKVSRGVARAPRRGTTRAALPGATASGVAGGLLLAGAGGWGRPGGVHAAPELLPFPEHLMDALGGRARKPPSPCLLPVGPAPFHRPQPGSSDLRARGAALSPFASPAKLLGNAVAFLRLTPLFQLSPFLRGVG